MGMASRCVLCRPAPSRTLVTDEPARQDAVLLRRMATKALDTTIFDYVLAFSLDVSSEITKCAKLREIYNWMTFQQFPTTQKIKQFLRDITFVQRCNIFLVGFEQPIFRWLDTISIRQWQPWTVKFILFLQLSKHLDYHHYLPTKSFIQIHYHLVTNFL